MCSEKGGDKMDDKRLERLENKIDKIHDSVASIDKTLLGQAVELKEHIRRTAAAEARVEQVSKDLEPIKTHVAAMGGVAKALGIAATVIAIIAGIVTVFG